MDDLKDVTRLSVSCILVHSSVVTSTNKRKFTQSILATK